MNENHSVNIRILRGKTIYEQQQGAVLKPLPTAKFSRVRGIVSRQKKCSHDISGFDEEAEQFPLMSLTQASYAHSWSYVSNEILIN